MSQPSPSGKRVLSIDGGALRGLGSLLVIEAITNAAHAVCREPGSPPLRPCEIFDVICGSATGGLLTILLGRLGLDCATAINEYKTLVQKLCGDDRDAFLQIIAKLSPNFDAKAHEEAYKTALAELVSRHGKSTDSPFHDPSDTSQTRTVIRYTKVPIASWDSSKKGTLVDMARRTTPFATPQDDNDVAYTDLINFTEVFLKSKHAKESLGADPPTSIISIGQKFADNAVDMKGSQARKAINEFVALVNPNYGGNQKWATFFVEKHLTQAGQTAEAHKKLSTTSGYQRVDPPLGTGKWELVDHFDPKVESTVKEWLESPEGKGLIDEIVKGLVVPLPPKPVIPPKLKDIIPPTVIPSPSGKRVLSIDGGALRGLGGLLVIEAITNAAHAICRESGSPAIRPCEIFDLICGSATGGLLTILLGRLGLDCATAITEYKTLVQKLCGDDRDAFMKILAKLSPTFDQKAHLESYQAALLELVSKYGLTADSRFYDLAQTRSVVMYTVVPTVSWNPTNRQTVVDVAQKTTPFVSPQDERDVAYTRLINPTESFLKSKLAKESLGADPPTSIISIGQRFADNAVDMKGSHARKAINDFVALISPGYGDNKQWATLFVEKHLTQAEQAAKVDKDLRTRLGYYRVDPPLGIGKWELVDHFGPELESTVKQWLATPEGKDLVDEIAKGLVAPLPPKPVAPPTPKPVVEPTPELVIPPKPVEPVVPPKPVEPVVPPKPEDMIPPPAPVGTIPPNPACEEPRPTKIDSYLKKYNVIFIIDDSTSMTYYGNRWDEARDALRPIADFALQHRADTIDMYFLNSTNVYKAVKSSDTIMKIFDATRPPSYKVRIQRTYTGACLQKILNDVIGRLDAAIGNEAVYKAIQPFDIIVLTDGDADDNPKAVLENAWARLQAKKHHPNYVRVQIVQIGNDAKATTKLQDLMRGNNGSIVDTVPYEGVVTPEKLQRIVLGAVQPNVRAFLA